MINSREDAHKSWMVRSFPSQSIKALHLGLYNKYNLYLPLRYLNVRISEAVVWSYSVNKMLLKILQNLQISPLAQEFPVNFVTF